MSHIVTIATEVRDPNAVAAACRRLGLPEPVHGTTQLFAGSATGLIVKLADWLYPLVIDTAAGRSATTITAARGAGRTTSTGSCSSTPSRRPAPRRDGTATPSPSRPWPTAPSG